jgi:hypothetical protein
MLYKIALFLHVTGALMLCSAIAIEWLCIINLRKTDSLDRVKESLFYYSKLGIIGDIAAFLVLIPGIYMMVVVWGKASWGILGLFGLLLIGFIGGTMTGKKMKKIREIIKTENRSSKEVINILKDKSLWISIKLRTTILVGVVFLMTVKPELTGSIITIIVSIILGTLPLPGKYYPSAAEVKL